MKSASVPVEDRDFECVQKSTQRASCGQLAESCPCGQCTQGSLDFLPDCTAIAFPSREAIHEYGDGDCDEFDSSEGGACVQKTRQYCDCYQCCRFPRDMHTSGPGKERNLVHYEWDSREPLESASESDEDENEEDSHLEACMVSEPPQSNGMQSDWEKLLGLADRELKAHNTALAEAAAGYNCSHSKSECGISTPAYGEARSDQPLKRPKPSRSYGGERNYDDATVRTVAGRNSVPVPPRTPSPTPPAVVHPSSPPSGPIRIQASGRRGPRGQSRYKGVCITRAGKWRAVIYIGRKQKYLGVFDSEFDAAKAYDVAALQHFAEGAKLNFTKDDQAANQYPTDKVRILSNRNGNTYMERKRGFDFAIEGSEEVARTRGRR
ncbi:unnamed protein product [Choristocarpus tenellus]